MMKIIFQRLGDKNQLAVKTLEPCLPESTQQEEKVSDPNYNHNFAKNVVWTFENTQMLIRTYTDI